MTGPKTNERPGTRAQVKNVRMSATKARAVLDLIRGLAVDEAAAILAYTERGAAEVVGRCLDSAIANAEHNDQIDPATLHVSACYADEGRTMYRWRPRARGRATKIRKRTCHITIIVSPMSAQMLAIESAKREAVPGSRAARRRGQEDARRSARVAASRGDVAEAAEEEGIVDQDAAATQALAEAGLAENPETATDAGDSGAAAEAAGIVDQDAPAADALEDAALAESGETAGDAAQDEPAADDETEEK
jgi:large subunit ribosomal protein L22